MVNLLRSKSAVLIQIYDTINHMDIKTALSRLIEGEVLDDKNTLEKYSNDASIFKIIPKIVVFPKDSQEIQKIVKFASENNIPITVRAGGTDMSGAAIGEGIILDLKNFNQILSINENQTTIQPGVFYRDFEKESLKYNSLLPTYPASREICTIGGMVANNAGGELELTYGPIGEYLKSLKIILADGKEYTFSHITKNQLNKKIAQKDLPAGKASFEGKIYSKINDLIKVNKKIIDEARPKVSKNSTGYELWEVFDGQNFDLSKLIIGSQGTLGIVTEASFSLIRPKKYQVLLVISLPDLNQLDQVVKQVLEFKPEAFECFDDQTYQLAIDHAWNISKNFKHTNRLSAFLDLKRDRKKKIPHLTLLANFTSDSKEESLQKTKSAESAIKELNLVTEIKESLKTQEKYWLIRHKSFGLLMKYSEGKRASPFIDDIIVKPQYLPEFLPKLNTIIEPYKDKMVYTLAGHIGDGNFHIIPLMDLSQENVRAIIPELMEKVFKLVFEYKGSMSGEHNDGLIRGPYLQEMYGEKVYQLFKEVKNIFDPKNIFNPHKKVDATFEYSLSHISNS